VLGAVSKTWTVYPASKTALSAFTLAMAIELESEGIKVSPGFTKHIVTGTVTL